MAAVEIDVFEVSGQRRRRVGSYQTVRQGSKQRASSVRYLFRRWLSRHGVRVIVDLKDLSQFGVWEVGLLTSFKREVDQRVGELRICNLDPGLKGYFQNDRFTDQFDVYSDLESAMRQKGKNT